MLSVGVRLLSLHSPATRLSLVSVGTYTLENFLSGGPPIEEASDAPNEEREEL